MLYHYILDAILHGHHCWVEPHYYTAHHNVYAWLEWLCK